MIANKPSLDDDSPLETQRGSIRHVSRTVPKGIQMLRLERELKPILDKWREAMKRDPKVWTPLMRGGCDCIHNIQPVCPTCNSRKGARRWPV